MRIDLTSGKPVIDIVSDPGRVVLVTKGKVTREWGRIVAEGGEEKVKPNEEGVYDLGGVSIHGELAERWRVELRYGRAFEFYFTALGMTFGWDSADDGIHDELVHMRIPVAAFTGGGPEAPPRYERV